MCARGEGRREEGFEDSGGLRWTRQTVTSGVAKDSGTSQWTLKLWEDGEYVWVDSGVVIVRDEEVEGM